jgi:hypothetical protein
MANNLVGADPYCTVPYVLRHLDTGTGTLPNMMVVIKAMLYEYVLYNQLRVPLSLVHRRRRRRKLRRARI